MSSKKSSMASLLLTLIVVTGVSAFSLGFVYEWTKEPIAQAKAEKQMRAIKSVVGNYDNDPLIDAYPVFKEKGKKQQHRFRRGRRNHADTVLNIKEEKLTFYPAKIDSEVQVTAVQASSDKGYNGKIELMVGIDKNGIIKNIEVLSHTETPGLGSKIKDEDFLSQFIGKTLIDEEIKVKKDGGDVDAISGATISSRAFCDAVTQALQAFNQTKDETGAE
ncbi:MAG: electron transport complex protein RnfG [Cyclobacteriaceae bacterium]|jgi:electron transport complex protein RnfG